MTKSGACGSRNAADHDCDGTVRDFKHGHWGDPEYQYPDERCSCERCNHPELEEMR